MCWMIAVRRFIPEICLGGISSVNKIYMIEKCEGDKNELYV